MKKLTRRVVRFKGLTVGLDVHLRFIQYVVLDRNGDEIAGGRLDSSQEGLQELFALLGRQHAQFILEACSCFLWVYDVLSERVGADQVHVAQPHRLRPIANSLEKNDANDAWWLAYLGFEGRLPEAYVAEGEIRELRIATRELRSAVDRRSDLIRRFRSHLVQAGLRLLAKNIHTVEGRSQARSQLEKAEGMRRMALERLLRAIEVGDEEVAAWRHEAEEACERLPVVRDLEKGITGLGPVTAAVVYAELGDPRRFRSAKAYAKATGLTPGYRESGGRRTPEKMTREGSAAARWAFTRAVIACLRCRRSPGVQVKYWVLRRCRHRPKRKVIVAAARKLAEGVWRLFALGEEFDLARAFPGKVAS
jgi:transposase